MHSSLACRATLQASHLGFFRHPQLAVTDVLQAASSSDDDSDDNDSDDSDESEVRCNTILLLLLLLSAAHVGVSAACSGS